MFGPDILQTIAEIAIALLGFTGVVVVLNPERTWRLNEEARLRNLLEGGGVVLLFSLLPALTDALGATPDQLWRIGNGALGVVHLLLTWAVIRRYRDILDTEQHDIAPVWMTGLLCGLSVLIAGIQLLDAAGWLAGDGWAIYLASLLWLTLLATLNFMVVLMLRRS